MTLQKKAGPIQVRSGSRLTGAEFYARALEERGTLAPIDNAIAAAFDALESKPTPIERAYVEKALLTIAGVFAGNPNGTEPLTPRIIEACQLLERFGAICGRGRSTIGLMRFAPPADRQDVGCLQG